MHQLNEYIVRKRKKPVREKEFWVGEKRRYTAKGHMNKADKGGHIIWFKTNIHDSRL